MILDGALMFEPVTGVSLAIAAGTQASTNTLDLTNNTTVGAGAGRNLGIADNDLKLFVQILTTFTSGGAGTLAYSLQGSVDNSAWTTMFSSPTIALANLVAGAQLGIDAIPDLALGQALPKYLRILWTVGTATMTAGAATAGLTLDRQRNIAYAPGIAINT